MNQTSIEKIGSEITWENIESTRTRSWQALHEIAAKIEVGMTEKEAIAVANRYFASLGVKKFWHKSHVRFGQSTVFSFNDPYLDDGYRLQEQDIFYLDLGPVFDGIEGDVGATFVLGKDPLMLACARDVKILFDQVREHWLQTQTSGAELCHYARQAAQALGWLFSPDYVKGHRLSEFPHSFHFKGTLADAGFHPSPKCWVLEIQIRHPELPVGAFYEDLLI